MSAQAAKRTVYFAFSTSSISRPGTTSSRGIEGEGQCGTSLKIVENTIREGFSRRSWGRD
jgi:hypothetical protein